MELTLTKNTFLNEVVKSELPVLVDFWATWCGPCRMLAPTIEELSEEYDGKMKVGKVNVDDEEELAMQFNITSIPTVIIFKNGKPVNSFVGAKAKAQIKDIIDKSI